MLYQPSSTQARTGLIYLNAKKHSAAKIVVTLKAPNNDQMCLFGYPAFQLERKQKLEVEISKKTSYHSRIKWMDSPLTSSKVWQ